MIIWRIKEIKAKDGLITEALYHVEITDESNKVETEGWWTFGSATIKKPFAEIVEDDVIDWIKADTTQEGKNIIESNLEEQLLRLENKKVTPPWFSQVFTLGDT
jgi:hypothetical protein